MRLNLGEGLVVSGCFSVLAIVTGCLDVCCSLVVVTGVFSVSTALALGVTVFPLLWAG